MNKCEKIIICSMAYGNEVGIVVVDILQKTCLLSICTPNLYGSADPYQRVPRSPKRTSDNPGDDRCRSPSADQVMPPAPRASGKASRSHFRSLVTWVQSAPFHTHPVTRLMALVWLSHGELLWTRPTAGCVWLGSCSYFWKGVKTAQLMSISEQFHPFCFQIFLQVPVYRSPTNRTNWVFNFFYSSHLI